MSVDLTPDDPTPLETCLPEAPPTLRLPPGLPALEAAKRRTLHFHSRELDALDIYEALDYGDWLCRGANWPWQVRPPETPGLLRRLARRLARLWRGPEGGAL